MTTINGLALLATVAINLTNPLNKEGKSIESALGISRNAPS